MVDQESALIELRQAFECLRRAASSAPGLVCCEKMVLHDDSRAEAGADADELRLARRHHLVLFGEGDGAPLLKRAQPQLAWQTSVGVGRSTGRPQPLAASAR